MIYVHFNIFSTKTAKKKTGVKICIFWFLKMCPRSLHLTTMRHQLFILVNIQLIAKIICSVWYNIYCSCCWWSSLSSKLWRFHVAKVMCTLFSAIATLCFCLRHPVIILCPHAGPSSKMSWKFLYYFWKMTMKELLHEGVPLKSLLSIFHLLF